SSIASDLPTTRARRCVPPVPGRTPRLTSGRPTLPAFSFASRMSHAIAISSPPPTVWPLSAAIVSLGVCSRRFNVSLAWRQKKYLKRGVTLLSIAMFAPAEKNFSPWPRSTMTCTLSSKRALRIASSSWCIISRSEEHTSELQSLRHLVCRLLLEKKKHHCAKGARRVHGPPALHGRHS